jgi:UDP-glucose 4-epimerase
MARLVGFDEPARYAMPRPGELQRSALDPARAANHLGWKPWTALEDGLRRTISWFRAVPVGSRR